MSSAALLSVAAQSSLAAALQEVVVTAQKREQSLQETPIAITAFGSRELEQKGITSVTDLGTFAPNVKITPLPSNTAAATIAIRGSVTSNPAITWEPTVGMYLDGTYIGKFSGNVFKIAELERVEVLRGPQGTLYGKNTIGGAVNMITKLPTGELGGTLRAGVGNYGFWEAYGSVDLPALQLGTLGELKAKVSYATEERDGFYETEPQDMGPIHHTYFGPPVAVAPNAVDTSQEHNAVDSEVARLDLLWDANERLSLRYTYDMADTDNTTAKTQLTAVNPASQTFGAGFPTDLGKYIVDADKNSSKNASDAHVFERFESDSHSLFANYDLGDLGALGEVAIKYIFNNRNLEFQQSLDNDGTPFSIFHSALESEYEQTSHEIQLTGVTQRTNYVVGLFYFEEEADVYNPLRALNSFFGPGSLQENRYGLEAEQKAVYGQIEWRPNIPALQDRLTLTGGLRWTQEEKDSYISHPDEPVVSFDAEADESWTNLAPTLIANYAFTDTLGAYVKYSKGWKSGGFNGESPTAEAFREGYDPEEVDAYEIGLKSRWLDNTLQFNGAVFYNKESDLQLSVFTPTGGSPVSAVRNAGASVKQGFEFEVIYQPITDLQLTANYGYLDAEYEEFEEFDPVAGMIVDKSDEKAFQYAPRHTANVGVEYTFAKGNWGDLTGRLDYSYVSEYVAYVNPDQNAPLGIDAYGLFNGRLTLANIPVAQESTLQFALWGKNLTDEEYRINGIPFGPFAVSYYGNPRTYGLDATLRF
jgi:iron complex outermembrane receptor protein